MMGLPKLLVGAVFTRLVYGSPELQGMNAMPMRQTFGAVPRTAGASMTLGLGAADAHQWRPSRSKNNLKYMHQHSPADIINQQYTGPLAPPVVIDNAVVRGPVSAEMQAEYDAEYEEQATAGAAGGSGVAKGRRSLLHGRRRPSRYSRCNVCTLVSCKNGNCSGHCKHRGKLFYCDKLNILRASALCDPVSAEQVESIPISPVYPPHSVTVTVPSPYIGCAEIAHRPSGCPAPGTNGWLLVGPRVDGGGATPVPYQIQSSVCLSQRYLPKCTYIPMYPAGICECSKVALDGRDLGTGPCSVHELEVDSARPGPGEDRVFVERRGDQTHTGFSDYTNPDEDFPRWAYSLQVPVDGEEAGVVVELEVFEGGAFFGSLSYEHEGTVTSADYYDHHDGGATENAYEFGVSYGASVGVASRDRAECRGCR